MDETQKETFGSVRARLDEIVAQVRSNDVSLEQSLDLYEEAIRLGNKCAELIDKPDYTPEEIDQAHQTIEAGAEEKPEVTT